MHHFSGKLLQSENVMFIAQCIVIDYSDTLFLLLVMLALGGWALTKKSEKNRMSKSNCFLEM